jgi:UDP-N-acetylmuramyl pentapeptide phosphotransferase/UDP-N-acetylglucosamine-1-phosphate transferase
MPIVNAVSTAWMAVAAAGVTAFAVSAWLSVKLSRNDFAWLHSLDQPNERSLHGRPVPRTGGVAVIAGILLGIAVALLVAVLFAIVAPDDADSVPGKAGDLMPLASLLPPVLTALLPAMLLVGAVSLRDDRRHVPQHWRLAAHLGASLLLILGGLQWTRVGLPGLDAALPLWLGWLLTVLYTVWMINLYNFMDGMDGFAGGMAVFGFGALAVLGARADLLGFAAVAAIIAAAALGFLTRNFPPARIFLGDVGSSVLGLLAAAMTLWGARLGLFPLWVGWLIFSPFIVDATWTLLRRIANRERFWQAHRSHHYQRLVLAGWSHRRTLLWGYVLMAAAALSAVAALGMTVSDQWTLLFGWAGIFALVHVRVGLTERSAAAAQSAGRPIADRSTDSGPIR